MIGVNTDVWVHSTMREGINRGYGCLLVEDATRTASGELHPAATRTIQHTGGILGVTAATDDVLEGIAEAVLGKLRSTGQNDTERHRLESTM